MQGGKPERWGLVNYEEMDPGFLKVIHDLLHKRQQQAELEDPVRLKVLQDLLTNASEKALPRLLLFFTSNRDQAVLVTQRIGRLWDEVERILTDKLGANFRESSATDISQAIKKLYPQPEVSEARGYSQVLILELALQEFNDKSLPIEKLRELFITGAQELYQEYFSLQDYHIAHLENVETMDIFRKVSVLLKWYFVLRRCASFLTKTDEVNETIDQEQVEHAMDTANQALLRIAPLVSWAVASSSHESKGLINSELDEVVGMGAKVFGESLPSPDTLEVGEAIALIVKRHLTNMYRLSESGGLADKDFLDQVVQILFYCQNYMMINRGQADLNEEIMIVTARGLWKVSGLRYGNESEGIFLLHKDLVRREREEGGPLISSTLAVLMKNNLDQRMLEEVRVIGNSSSNA